jgi:hypothetical protein
MDMPGKAPGGTPVMSGLANLNLIHFLDFYFMLMFVVGTMRRIGQYREVVHLVLKGPTRWPRLLRLVKAHRTIFFTWATLLPAILAFLLSVVQLMASRQLWPQANLTLAELSGLWSALIPILPLGLAMMGVDVYFVVAIGKFDRSEMEKYFDQAEYWLRSRTAHVVRIFTLGYINPRQMVGFEVRKALLEASQLLQVSLWWMTVQVGLRIAFGLALWGTWVFTETN